MRGFRLLLVALAAVTLTSCDGVLGLLGFPTDDDIDQFAPEPASFDIDLFHTNFLNQVGNQWTGFAYAISQSGTLAYSDGVGSWDVAGAPADETSKVYGASINKYVAAIGVMRLIELEPSVDLDDGIAGYLPNVWTDSAFIQTVTIRELLDHTSGIPGAGVPGFTANTYDSDHARLKDIAQTGLDPGDTVATGYAYSNANYGFLRLLIAGLEGASYTGTDSSDATNAIGAYATFMQREVFDKAGPPDGGGGFEGISPATSPSAVQYYAWGTTLPGWSIGNRSGNLASGGYYFSVFDLAQLMAYVNHTTQILTWQSREALYDNFFGLTDGALAPQNPNGAHGWYYSKAGSLADSNGRGVRNFIAILPLGVEVVFMANSRGGVQDGTAALQNAIFAAYDAAWQ